MPEPLRWVSKVLLFKTEASYGVDPTPTQAILAKNIVCRPMQGEDVSRDIERPFFGAQQMFPVGLRVQLEFDVELVGSGTAGTAPAWGELLRACAAAETINAGVSTSYSRVSTGLESAAAYFWIGDNKQVILGIRGDAEFKLDAQQIPTIHFTFTGLYADPAATATPAIDTSAFQAPLVATKVNTPTFTIGGVPLVMKSFSFKLNNDVQPRLLIGREEIVIVDAQESIDVTVEAVPLATFNPFTTAKNGTSVAATLTHDTRAGFIASFAFPTCQLRRPEGYENDQKTLMWPLKLDPLPTDAGNDQWSLTLT